MTPTSLLAAALIALAPLAGRGGIPHERLARDYLATHGQGGRSAAEFRLDELLAGHFAIARAGVFETYFPVAGLESRAGDLKDCVLALLDAEEQVLEWTKPSGRDQKAIRADLKAVSGWWKGLRPEKLAKAKEPAGKDVAEVLGAPEAVLAASQRLVAGFGKGEPLGLARDPADRIRVMLVPTRREFAEIVSLIGWYSEEWRAAYWVDGISDWSTCWMEDFQVIALEHATPGHPPEDYTSGEPLNKREPTGMGQQVVQLSAQRAFEQLYGDRVPPAVLGGLAMNLVIDQFGEINTRVDGDVRGRSASRRDVFVPGGASDGGFLPKNSAETRWREDRGKDRFVRVLRLAQKEGEGLDKNAENKAAFFAVRSDKGGATHKVSAPFLAPPAEDAKAPPAEFLGDHAEMLRAYRCAFVAWLQSRTGGAEKSSREKFALLLEKLADPAADLDSVSKAVFEGAAFTDATASKESLEGKFLLWLAKQK